MQIKKDPLPKAAGLYYHTQVMLIQLRNSAGKNGKKILLVVAFVQYKSWIYYKKVFFICQELF